MCYPWQGSKKKKKSATFRDDGCKTIITKMLSRKELPVSLFVANVMQYHFFLSYFLSNSLSFGKGKFGLSFNNGRRINFESK